LHKIFLDCEAIIGDGRGCCWIGIVIQQQQQQSQERLTPSLFRNNNNNKKQTKKQQSRKMKQVTILLTPTPGAKPEFLASVIPLNKGGPPPFWSSLEDNNKQGIVLEGYTRDDWSLDTSTKWISLTVRSIDGKNKLPGFVNYLRERKKTAFGRFVLNQNPHSSTLVTYVWAISHKQTSSTILSCRVASLSSIPNCPLKPKSATIMQQQQQQQQQKTMNNNMMNPPPPKQPPPQQQQQQPSTTNSQPPKKKGFGLLGNLVGAQKRTNLHVVSSSAGSGSNKQIAKTTTSSNSATTTTTTTTGGAAETTGEEEGADGTMTSGQVLSDFRNEMEQKMLDFDISPEVSMKVFVKLSDHAKKAQDADKDKVTMEVLKYIVYEQAEEVNDEWIAHKEPSEFMDECTIAIYKDPEEAPPEVLEELNRAEIPEEMKAQQKMAEQHRRQQEQKILKQQELLQKERLKQMANSGGGDDGDSDFLAALNTQKRDRRTVEDYERETKRFKGE
jgi:hypothetical protein